MGRDSATARSFKKCLRNDRAQRLREHTSQHLLLGGREDIDDAVDRLRGGARMQSAKHQMACFRSGECQPYRLKIVHFADQNDVRILTKRGT